ncbi:MAG: AAA family ATPase, partial [Campylobacterota bacterium]|nr:AAA family ATPase [Campylobacterota bacterium]
MSNYITEIKINKVRHLENLSINLGDEKKHLILTGKNGSGKTSVLEELDNLLLVEPLQLISFGEPTYTDIPNVSINHEYDNQEYFYAYFSAKRTSNTMQKPNGIEKIELSKIKDKKLNTYFLKYIVALKAERSFAKDDNDEEIVKKIDSWFNTFEEMLRQIFNDDSLQLQFDRRNIMSYNFLIKRSNREPFDFTTLSDGYSAIIDIVTEILLKIETTESKSFDVEGIVLIDEVEAHLHVEMQKHIMRLLTEFFPKIQFIITTHSPFVLQSIENSVVYDLERKEQLSSDALHDASYTQIVKNYFKVDSEYS